MESTKPYKKGMYAFFKSAIIHPKQNIDSHNDLSVIKNIALCLMLFIGTAITLYVAYIPIFETFTGPDEYASMGILVVIAGLIIYLLLTPAMLINIYVLYLLNKKFGNIERNFKKVLSDHTTIWIATFLLYSIGLYFYSYLDILRPYITLAGTLVILISIVIYLRRLILLAQHYVKDEHKTIVNVYTIILFVAVLLGLPYFINNIAEGFFIEIVKVNVQILFDDLGIKEFP